jgi:predicted metalloprotease with PDZ domain
MKKLIILLFLSLNLYAQEHVFRYELDLTNKNDAFNVTVYTPPLSDNDNIYSFVSYAPGVHQPLDFGRFIKMFKVYDKDGNELITNKISINDFEILEPARVSSIVYEIDDSFDMNTTYHPIYPMSGTGINDNYTIINPHGVFGYFNKLKNNPILLTLEVDGDPKIGTALNKNTEGSYVIDSYYHLTDSPILIGDNLSYASTKIDDIEVEAYVHSPSGGITAQMVLDQAESILNSAKDFIGYSPVERYTFLMYFASHNDISEMPVFRSGGALEHSLSSTYALPDNPQYLPLLKNIIAHEFMHILSPLHLHSNILANFDYSNPVSEDKHVWLYEGVTEWASYYMQFKSGIISFEDYINYLSKKANNSKKYRTDYSLTRISREWSTDEGNKQYGNIYQLGALTAAMLDIKLIQLSNGKKNLRNVYIELIKKYGKDNPFDNDAFFDVLVDLTYPEISDFIDKHIINNNPFDFEQEMNSVGVKYFNKKRNKENLATMGLKIDQNSTGQLSIVGFTTDYMGSQLKEGDIISQINNKELNHSTYQEIMSGIKKMNVEDEYQIDIIRNGTEIKILEKLYPKYDENVFEVDQNATGKSKKLSKIFMAIYE